MDFCWYFLRFATDGLFYHSLNFFLFFFYMVESLNHIPLPALLKMSLAVIFLHSIVKSHGNKTSHSEEWETHSSHQSLAMKDRHWEAPVPSQWEDSVTNTCTELSHLLLSEDWLCRLGDSSLSLILHDHMVSGCCRVYLPWGMHIFCDQLFIGVSFRGLF